MSDSTIKTIRKQIRNVVIELLPQLLKEEIFAALNTANENRIKQIEEQVRETMREMNERQKDTMGYLVRQATKDPVDKA